MEEIERVGVFGIHLEDYIFWDDERQTEFVCDTYRWRETQIEGTDKRYTSAECIMPGTHDFSCCLKRGVRARHLPRQRGCASRAAHPGGGVRPQCRRLKLATPASHLERLARQCPRLCWVIVISSLPRSARDRAAKAFRGYLHGCLD